MAVEWQLSGMIISTSPTHQKGSLPIGRTGVVPCGSCRTTVGAVRRHFPVGAVGAVGLSGSGMTDYDMGYRPCLSEGTVGLSYGSCQDCHRNTCRAVGTVGALSVLCRCSVGALSVLCRI